MQYGKTYHHLQHQFATLCSTRNHNPSDKHKAALDELLRVFAKSLHGELEPHGHLCALAPGLGKSTALLTACNYALTAKAHRSTGILVCINTHDEITEFCKGLTDLSRVRVWVGKKHQHDMDQFCGVDTVGEAQLLITTHARVFQEMRSPLGELRDFGEAKTLHFKGKPRLARYWDESLLLAAPICIEATTLNTVAGHIDNLDPDLADSLRVVSRAMVKAKVNETGSLQFQMPKFRAIDVKDYRQFLSEQLSTPE